MVILGIVGSPRKNGRTNQLIDAALAGAATAGAETTKIYLVDHDIRPFTGAGGSGEAFRAAPRELARLCGEAGAIVLGAPVYWGDINGLTKDFMDTVATPNSNGKPALGIAIAGGSGKGLYSGVQSIYHFFYHRQMRGIDPAAVSRFNMEETLASLKESGAKLVELANNPTPFVGDTADARWADVLAYYATIDYMDRDPVDEFVTLAQQLVKISEGGQVEEARRELDLAVSLIAKGERSEAARHAVKSYQLLYFAGSD